MAHKVWVGGDTAKPNDFSVVGNWEPFSIRNNTYRWTVSAAQAGEYRLELAAGGNPSIEQPDAVYQTGSALGTGTLGSLPISTWNWGDNDALGYSTVYVRALGTVDPDTLVLDDIQWRAVPKASDDVEIAAYSENGILNGLDADGTQLTSFKVMAGYSSNIGTDSQHLQLNMTGQFEYCGAGTLAKFNFGTSDIDPVIRDSGVGNTGEPAVQLVGSSLSDIYVFRGQVAIGFDEEDATTEANTIYVGYMSEGARSTDSRVWIGDGVTNLAGSGDPDILQSGGIVQSKSDIGVLTVDSGEYWQVKGKWTTGRFSGTSVVYPDGDGGTYTTTTLHGPAQLRNTHSLGTKTFTNSTAYAGSSFLDPKNRITRTNPINTPDGAETVGIGFGPNVRIAVTAIP